jgi:hypothetical protein
MNPAHSTTALFAALATLATTSNVFADPLNCDLRQYRPNNGLTAAVEAETLVVTWSGEKRTELRVTHAIEGGRPVIRQLEIRGKRASWHTLGRNLTPEYHLTSGMRRMSNQQAQPLRQLGVAITPEVIEKEKWYVFWDAPLLVPGIREGQRPEQARNIGLPRRPAEIRRATSSFATTSCALKTDGGRIEVTFPGLSMGIFAGSLRYTSYRGSNLLRMEAIAKTDEPSVAYKYQAGLRGFSTALTPRVAWRDQGGDPQDYEFGGATNETPVPVKARTRVSAHILLGARGRNKPRLRLVP